jgi:ribonuclease HI
METIICFTAGEANGNPGPAAIGVYIVGGDGAVLHEVGQGIGNGTATYAAYQAVLVGLQALTQILGSETKTVSIDLRLDNESVQEQLNAKRQITDPGLVPLFVAIHNLCVECFPNLTFTGIPKEQNEGASKLVSGVLDGGR